MQTLLGEILKAVVCPHYGVHLKTPFHDIILGIVPGGQVIGRGMQRT